MLHFKQPIKYYLDYLQSLDINSLTSDSLKRSIILIQKENKKNGQISKSIKHKKLILKKKNNITPIKKGLFYLLKKMNKKADLSNINTCRDYLIHKLFNVPSKNLSLSNNLDIDKRAILEFIILIEKTGLIERKRISIPKLINNILSGIVKGVSEKNLYRIMKGINHDNLTFNGITSELALKNEMYY